MTLDQLRAFVAVVHHGSFTRAAEALGTQKSQVSRTIGQLEAALGAQLLERTTRRLAVTETGREVHERALGILGAVDDTARVVQAARGVPQGLLRLTCGVEFGLLAVARWVEEFVRAWPEVSVDVEYSSRVQDIVHEGFDLAVRVGTLPDSRLVARPLGVLEYGLFACPRYLAAHGTPRTVTDLQAHERVSFRGGTAERRRLGLVLVPPGGGEPVRVEGAGRLRVDNVFAVRDALLASLGIGSLPLVVAEPALRAARLVPVLPGWAPPPVPVSVVYPSNRYLAPKVRAFVDLAVLRFPEAGAAAREAVRRACAPPARRSRETARAAAGSGRRAG